MFHNGNVKGCRIGMSDINKKVTATGDGINFKRINLPKSVGISGNFVLFKIHNLKNRYSPLIHVT